MAPSRQAATPAPASFTLHPIGVVRSAYQKPAEAPRQPGVDHRHEPARIELFPGHNFEQALEDLAGFDRIWILCWFDRVRGWKPKVLPPRGTAKRGVFATRSPHRPNPIGLTVARVVKIRGRRIEIAETDLLDGTPVLDLKPYIPAIDAYAGSAAGWLDSLPPENQVKWSAAARRAAEFLLGLGIDLIHPAERILALGTDPHPYRRVSKRPRGQRELALESWRLQFHVKGAQVMITAVYSGYSAAAIRRGRDAQGKPLHQREAHQAFLKNMEHGTKNMKQTTRQT